MKNSFQIIIGSPVNYKKIVAYIVIDGNHVALLSQEEGIEKIKIEFFDEPKIKELNFEVFLEALNKAKAELLK
ncbi:MAG: hypothetical protein A2W93_04895 [Bacteroidetes bacterium GWF2_43_63]|nr:MAG: hypothetical protein A2W94_12255 [Bacteroidetes bacterium GWE2_42_42]OFY56219.1 MAG: hypothetical protein A2W93_04895 [Bacteroidetes bacterium GWF2_43_63]HBG71889.1 hypothetical protein [Bacteroidales bacterium]HCB61790.1 hypothetical protein [Bacteroidales bacterium]HCY23812.1 hypothetical protein [Bacteroidales bacterium]